MKIRELLFISLGLNFSSMVTDILSQRTGWAIGSLVVVTITALWLALTTTEGNDG